jgi:hypothetical protein
MRITDLSISNRLGLAIMIPLVAALTLASMELLDSWRSYRQMQTVVKASENIKAMGEMIHVLQGERGQSAGYIGAKGSTDGKRCRQRVSQRMRLSKNCQTSLLAWRSLTMVNWPVVWPRHRTD